MVLVITPWVIRNYKLTGHIVLMSINGGRSFWACNNEVVLNEPRLTGRWADLSHLPELPQFLSCRNPYEQDRTAYGYGIKFIKSHLKDMPRLEMMKVYRLFTPFYNTPNKIFNIIGGLSWALLSIFVLWGFIVTFGNTRLNSLYSTVLLTLFIALVFCGDHRFREAIAPFLAVYAAVGWFHFTKWLKSKRQA
jgi:hypothetical protein